jgi:hypothetical protein
MRLIPVSSVVRPLRPASSVLCTAALLAFGAGCDGGDSSKETGDADTDTDADGDTDADSDADTDETGESNNTASTAASSIPTARRPRACG